jgi:biotin transport system substrate-specific component
MNTLVLRQTAKEMAWLRELSIVLLASVLIGCSAQLSIKLPFTPVPIVFYNHVILLLAALLGSKRATAAVLAFLFQAAIGLPVLANGKGGLLAFAGPTGGYLIGYIVAAYLTGRIIEKLKERTPAKVFGAMLAGSLAIFIFGFAHLAGLLGMQKAFLLGVLPFIPGDLLKTILCVRALKGLRFFS